MAAHYVCAKSTGWSKATGVAVYNGMGLDGFAYVGHFIADNDGLIESELFPISQNMDIYAQCDEATMRVKGGNVEVFRDMHLIAGSKMSKLNESD